MNRLKLLKVLMKGAVLFFIGCFISLCQYGLASLIGGFLNVNGDWIMLLEMIILIMLRIHHRSTEMLQNLWNLIEDRSSMEIFESSLSNPMEGAYTKVNIIHCMTVGPPGVGKTTLKKQLLAKNIVQRRSNRTPSPPSSPAVEISSKISCRKRSDKSSNEVWSAVSLEEEFLLRIKTLRSSFASLMFNISFLLCWSLWRYDWVKNHPKIAIFVGVNVPLLITLTFVYLFFVFISFWRSYANSLLDRPYFKILCTDEVQKKADLLTPDTIIINFRDCGGQPEFHEVLPALVPHPTLFLLMFDLSEGLDKQYDVSYRVNNDKISKPYQTSFTVRQFLLQTLASVQSIDQLNSVAEKKACKLCHCDTVVIGTHKDILNIQENEINQIQQDLETAIKGTDWYKRNMIVPTPDEHLLLPINMYSPQDIELVKDMIIKSVTERKNHEVNVSANLLGFEYALQKENKPVMTLQECKILADEFNISTRDKRSRQSSSFQAALSFLHHKTGTIRYFKDIPSMKNTVITDPQILFDLLSDLIIDTFTFTIMDNPYQCERFRSSGRFVKRHLEKCSAVNKKLLTKDQIIDILQHLNVIAPVGRNEENEEEYFFPCVLVHAPISSTISQDSIIGHSPLLIIFKCGYTPRGMFSCLIAYILRTNKGQWVLASDTIYRNQVKFLLKDSGHVILVKNQLKYLEMSVIIPHNSNTVPQPNFVKIRTFLSNSLNQVRKELKYAEAITSHSFGFYCTSCTLPTQHPAQYHVRYKQCTVTPSLTSVLKPEEQVWFGGQFSGDTSQVYNFNKPTVSDWSLHLRPLVNWEQFAVFLPGIQQHDIDRIRSDETGVENRKLALWTKWTAVYPNGTWNDVINALKSTREYGLADEIVKKLK